MLLNMIQKSEAVENFKGNAEQDCNQCCQNHALYADSAEGKFCAGQADNHNNGSHNKVGRFAVINLAFYQYAQAAGCNNAEQQDAHAAHNRYGNAVNQLGELADEGKQNGKYCRAADNPYAVNLGNGHNADVFAVSGVRSCTEEAG